MTWAGAGARLLVLVIWTVVLLPVQAVAVRLDWPLARRLPRIYHRFGSRLMGLRIRAVGRPSAARPTLFISNHSTYLDIVVLGALLEASFVARHDIAGWPVFGTLARLQRSVFVERRPSRSGAQRDEMQQRLDKGDSLVLFPEGTSSDGKRVLRFHSTFFAIAEREAAGQPICVQPLSVTYVERNGLPVGTRHRPRYAWYGEMNLLSHLWQVVCGGPVGVRVDFHDPVTIGGFDSRKSLARYCQDVVTAGVSAANAGGRRGHGTVPQPPPGSAPRPVLDSQRLNAKVA